MIAKFIICQMVIYWIMEEIKPGKRIQGGSSVLKCFSKGRLQRKHPENPKGMRTWVCISERKAVFQSKDSEAKLLPLDFSWSIIKVRCKLGVYFIMGVSTVSSTIRYTALPT